MSGFADRQGRGRTRREKLAGYFFNLSQLAFTALVLGGIVLFFQESGFGWKLAAMLVFGCLMTLAFAMVGNNMLKK